jgi:hypothetical protein
VKSLLLFGFAVKFTVQSLSNKWQNLRMLHGAQSVLFHLQEKKQNGKAHTSASASGL